MPVSDKRIRILTVDDHPLLRDGIAALIEGQPDMVLVGEAANGLEAIECYRECHPDITLMDLQMPQMGGIDAMIAIRDQWPDFARFGPSGDWPDRFSAATRAVASTGPTANSVG